MGSKDPRIDAYIEKAQPFAKPILRQVRKGIHAGCPDVVETIKWSTPAFDYKGLMCGMAAFKAYCSIGFWKESLLVEIPEVREPVRQLGKLTSIDDLPPEKVLVSVVKQAAKLNAEGVKVKREPTAPKAPLKVPGYFAEALKKNKKAKAAFDAFSPSHRREYVEWITDAKQEATRKRRLDTALQWIAEGKSRNWKYERC
jgi:uncharacterized protein YdeI (YjbR/CyaY-like superfamily)